MDSIYALSLSAMQQDMERVDRVALNMANIATPGYKREVSVTLPFAELVAGDTSASLAPLASAAVKRLDMRSGSLRTTGSPLDVAITTDGYFEVRTPDGVAYTRNGSFRRDEHGRLVTSQGYAVMGRDGEIVLPANDPLIEANGAIVDSDATNRSRVATNPQIKVVKFDDVRGMQRLGEGLYSAGIGPKTLGESDPCLRQGSLETSNVSSAQEMIDLMQTMRHFESQQKVLQGYDDLLGIALHKLGDLS